MRLSEQEAIFGRTVDIIGTSANAMMDAMDDGFFNIITNKFDKLEDVVLEFGNTMLKMLIQIATNKIFFSIFGAALGPFTGGASAAVGGALSAGTTAALHQGGYIRNGMDTSSGYTSSGGRPYGGKYHSGGEVDITALSGEGVVNRRGMESLGVDNLNKLNRGQGMGGGGVVNNYYIQTIDERSFRDRLQQHGDIYSGATERGISDNRSIRKTIQRYGT